MVSKIGIKKFKLLYFNEFGIELTTEEAIEKANRILCLYRATYKDNINIRIKNGEKLPVKQNNK